MSAPAAGVSSAMRKVRLASALNPSCLRVLLAIMQLADEWTPITTRLLASRLNYRSNYWIILCVKRLSKMGMISYEPTKCGTIWPLVRFIPAESLSENSTNPT